MTQPPQAHHSRVRRAAELCPVRAITACDHVMEER